MIRTTYDPEANIQHVMFGPPSARYDHAEEVAPGVFVSFDAEGRPIGIEVISAHRRSASAIPPPPATV